MEGLEEFAVKLTSFLESKYFPTVKDVDILLSSLNKNYESGTSYAFTKNIGIAVLVLSYTFRPEFKKRFNNVQFFFKSKFNFTAFALKFSQAYFENPSFFKVLIICSLISELGIYFHVDYCCPENYNYYVSNSLEFILQVVCSDYMYKAGGWKALDATAKKISQGYEILQSVIEGESPFCIVPITKALRCALSRREENVKLEQTAIDPVKSNMEKEKTSNL